MLIALLIGVFSLSYPQKSSAGGLEDLKNYTGAAAGAALSCAASNGQFQTAIGDVLSGITGDSLNFLKGLGNGGGGNDGEIPQPENEPTPQPPGPNDIPSTENPIENPLDITGGPVPTSDSTTQSNTAGTEAATKATNKKITCIDKIAHHVAQAILHDLTLSTVNWINGGFNGSPTFVQDPKSFFKSIADEQTQGFVNIIGFDSVKYPFGKMVAQSLVRMTTNNFEKNAQYSLDAVIRQQSGLPNAGYADFMADFNVGGWSAWSAMIGNPANNPVGFYDISKQRLDSLTAGTNDSVAGYLQKQLTASNGFLDIKQCVDPTDYDSHKLSDTDRANLQAIVSDPSGNGADDQTVRAAAQRLAQGTCRQWQTVTPGHAISTSLDKVIGSPFDQLGLGKDLDQDLTLIFDTLINTIVQKGLSSPEVSGIGNSGGVNVVSYGSSLGGAGSNSSNGNGGSFASTLQNQSHWDSQLKTFNALTDIPKVIQDQNNYISALNGVTGALKKYKYKLYELDYCIPGPHPGYENDLARGIRNLEKALPETSEAIDATQDSVGNAILHFFFGSGSSNLHFFFGSGSSNPVSNFFFGSPNSHAEKAADTYSAWINGSTGIELGYDGHPDAGSISTKEQAVNVFEKIKSEYTNAISNTYIYASLPAVAAEAASEYRNIAGYNDAITASNTVISNMSVYIKQLNRLQERVVAVLPCAQGECDAASSAAAASEVDSINRAFVRLAPNLFTASDVATINDLTKDFLNNKIPDVNKMIKDCHDEVAFDMSLPVQDQILLHDRMPYPTSLYPGPQSSSDYDFTPNTMTTITASAGGHTISAQVPESFLPGYIWGAINLDHGGTNYPASHSNILHISDIVNIMKSAYIDTFEKAWVIY